MNSTLRTLYAFSAIALCMSTAALAEDNNDSFRLGVEGFYDRYREVVDDSTFVKTHTFYGSLTGGYTANIDDLFAAIDVRASYGEATYSGSGNASGIPEWEYDLRLRGGTNIVWGMGTFSPYAGLGLRDYIQEGKGKESDTGAGFYDRRIAQLYLPIGVTYTRPIEEDWFVAPNIEYDPLLVGSVNSRLQNIPGYYNIYNVQHSGWGMRGELMFGQKAAANSNEISWEVGPFVRYWDIKDSKVSTDPVGNQYLEPANTRVQAGAALRVMW